MARKTKNQAQTVKITWKEVKRQKVLLGSYLRHIWSYFLLSAIERMDYGFSKL